MQRWLYAPSQMSGSLCSTGAEAMMSGLASGMAFRMGVHVSLGRSQSPTRLSVPGSLQYEMVGRARKVNCFTL